MVFSFLRRRDDRATRDLYAAIVAQARQPHFYAHLAVPDTLDGRFDMIALHATLLFRRLEGEGERARVRAQEVFDTFFRDMDHALREMGTSDTSVPHKIKRMAELFYGEADAYMKALEDDDPRALEAALARNVYAGQALEARTIAALAAYVRAAVDDLAAQKGATLVAGRVAWPDPQRFAA